MHRTYAVTWREGQAPPHSGKLELRVEALSLEGTTNGSGTQALLVAYADMVGLRMAAAPERLDGRPTLVLELKDAESLRVASVAAPGIVSEVAEELAALKQRVGRRDDEVAVIVPIAKGALDDVRALLDEGPPFDPEQLGLGRHQVFLSDREVIFIFESGAGFDLQRLLDDPSVWASAAAWHDCVAGVPRIARPFYSWEAPVIEEAVFFTATPGPGDSDGGDVYPPES
jgi:hypothetical protein